MSQTELREAAGAILVERKEDNQQYRFWFDETARGRIALCGIVSYGNGIRAYLDIDQTPIPTDVLDALDANGYASDKIYDANGRVVTERDA